MLPIEENDYGEPEIELVHKRFHSGEELDGGRNQRKLDRITVDPDVMQGKPCIRGMRITVSMVLGLLISGYSNEDILQEYPMLEEDDILQSKNYAYVLCGGYYDSIGNEGSPTPSEGVSPLSKPPRGLPSPSNPEKAE